MGFSQVGQTNKKKKLFSERFVLKDKGNESSRLLALQTAKYFHFRYYSSALISSLIMKDFRLDVMPQWSEKFNSERLLKGTTSTLHVWVCLLPSSIRPTFFFVPFEVVHWITPAVEAPLDKHIPLLYKTAIIFSRMWWGGLARRTQTLLVGAYLLKAEIFAL